MTLWVCKGGKRGERESRFIENSVIAIGFGLLNDLTNTESRADLKSLYGKVWPNASEGRKRSHAGQIYAFLTKVKIKDLVIVPMRTSGTIWIGEIRSEYKFRTDLGSDMRHTRNVKWIKKNVPRNRFDQDLLYACMLLVAIVSGDEVDTKTEEDIKEIQEATVYRIIMHAGS